MFRQLLVGLLSVSLVFTGVDTSWAGKSYSSGGSRSSSSRSFSSGSSRSSSSYSGKSYSSGSSKSSSSGSSWFGSSSSKSSSSPSSSSGSSWFGSSSSKSSPSGKSYSSGNSSSSPSSGSSWFSSSSSSRKPTPAPGSYGPGSSFNSKLSSQGQQATSASSFKTKPQAAPKPTFTSAGGKTVNVNPTAPATQTVRSYVTHERYVTYDHRGSTFFGPTYWGHPYPTYYSDPYSGFFWGWFWGSAMSHNDRAIYIYNHQKEMDPQRYSDALAKDAELAARVKALEAANAARDPNYVPPQLKDNPDLQYDPNFVSAAYNGEVVEEPYEGGGGFWTFLKVIFYICCGIAVLWFLKWVFFDLNHTPGY